MQKGASASPPFGSLGDGHDVSSRCFPFEKREDDLKSPGVDDLKKEYTVYYIYIYICTL